MNIVIAGVGGQGTVLASKIIAEAAAVSGFSAVRTGETIGMSQRGGSVVSFVRFGECDSPYFAKGQADLLIAFEICEAARSLPYLKKGGKAVINDLQINPVTVSLGNAVYDTEKMKSYINENASAVFLNALDIAKTTGSEKCVNTVMLGAAAASDVLPLSKESIIAAIEKNVKPKFIEMNITAFTNAAKN